METGNRSFESVANCNKLENRAPNHNYLHEAMQSILKAGNVGYRQFKVYCLSPCALQKQKD